MKRSLIFGIVGAAAVLAAVSPASAWECPLVKRPHVAHHAVRHHHVSACAVPAPEKVQDTPVTHETHVIEKVIGHHEVVELPPRVIVRRPLCSNTSSLPPTPQPQPQSLGCCPPGQYIPGLPPCSGSIGAIPAPVGPLCRSGFHPVPPPPGHLAWCAPD